MLRSPARGRSCNSRDAVDQMAPVVRVSHGPHFAYDPENRLNRIRRPHRSPRTAFILPDNWEGRYTIGNGAQFLHHKKYRPRWSTLTPHTFGSSPNATVRQPNTNNLSPDAHAEYLSQAPRPQLHRDNTEKENDPTTTLRSSRTTNGARSLESVSGTSRLQGQILTPLNSGPLPCQAMSKPIPSPHVRNYPEKPKSPGNPAPNRTKYSGNFRSKELEFQHYFLGPFERDARRSVSWGLRKTAISSIDECESSGRDMQSLRALKTPRQSGQPVLTRGGSG